MTSLAEEINNKFANYFSIILKYRRTYYLIIVVSLLCGLLFVNIARKRYTARSTIFPTGQVSDIGMLAKVAGYMPMDFLNEGMVESSSFLFPDIIRSREVLVEVLTTPLEFHKGGELIRITPLEYFKANLNDATILRFRKRVKVESSLRTGLITVSFTDRNPEFAAGVVNLIVDELDEFNRTKRKFKAKENIEYIRGRLDDVGKELAQIEDTLTKALEQNRNYQTQGSPRIRMEIESLQREYQIKSSTYTMLAQQLEQENLKRRRDTPIVSILDRASPPTKPSFPRKKLLTLSILLVALAVGTLVIFYRESTGKAGAPAASQQNLVSCIREDIVSIARFFKGRK
ncbi:hypothetical protein DRQ19_03945 [bacterium]|nr:MAG: hypothetical protein DRQ19_03945 [bacterium]